MLYFRTTPEMLQFLYSTHGYTHSFLKKKLRKMSGRNIQILICYNNEQVPNGYQEIDICVDINGNISIKSIK